ncbi:SDR family NAD(P)-dependent oxidoreductase [Pelagibaculum spongiae]|nr:SDR family oxidoreductase [Pelagibaculum spongiae]
MFNDFQNKHVVVTGASSGIGFAVAEAFVNHGAIVYIVAKNDDIFIAEKKLQKLSNKKVTALKCDISCNESLKNEFSKIDTIDVFIANAGVEFPTPINDNSNENMENFQNIINTNVTGTYLSIKNAIDKIPDRGCILITSSIWGKTAVPEFSAYISSKHANLGLMKVLAKELGTREIRVNAVCPGWVKTAPAMHSLKKMALHQNTSQETLLNELASEQCFGEVQEPNDVALCYLMLASSYAINITGQAVNADRGALVV